jgi:hypothetical protein
VWAVAVAASLFVASETEIGPVVLDLSKNHGIHAGDLMAVGVAALVASVTTTVILRSARKSR